MNSVEPTIALWGALAVFIFSAVAINRLQGRLPPSRGTAGIALLLQACCCIGALLCVGGIVLALFR